jgi:hypothetical protein
MNNYRYVVISPLNILFVRCKTYQEAKTFIEGHVKRNQANYKFLCGNKLTPEAYSIRDLESIPIYENGKVVYIENNLTLTE